MVLSKTRRALMVITLAAVAPPSWALAAGAGNAAGPDGEDLRIPGLPPIDLPPGTRFTPPAGGPPTRDREAETRSGLGSSDRRDIFRDFGGGMVPEFRRRSRNSFGEDDETRTGPDSRRAAPPRKPPTPEQRAAAIRKALAPKPPLAVVRRKALDELYTKLAAAADQDEAKGIATLIGSVWMRSGSDTANLLMRRVVQSIETKDYPLAIRLLDQIIALRPRWAEAWNKRASVRYFSGDLDGSMSDVEHVLKLEPKHFGALEGMATMLQRAGLDKRALEVYRRALAVYPHQPDVEKIVEKLTLEVEGQRI